MQEILRFRLRITEIFLLSDRIAPVFASSSARICTGTPIPMPSRRRPRRLRRPPRKRSLTRRPRKLPTARRAIQAHPTVPRRIMGRPQAAPIILGTRAIHPPRKTRENPIASRVAATAATPAQTPIQAVHRKRMTPRLISTTGLPRQKPSITTRSTRPSTTTRNTRLSTMTQL